jgi:hypothetical protein
MRQSKAGQAASTNGGSCTASRKLRPMARSATFGRAISRITVLRMKSWAVLFGAEGCRQTYRRVLLRLQQW